MTKASKKSIELQTAYVYRTNLPRRHHYSGECSYSGPQVRKQKVGFMVRIV